MSLEETCDDTLGQESDLINCETHRGVLQLWGHADYCSSHDVNY